MYTDNYRMFFKLLTAIFILCYVEKCQKLTKEIFHRVTTNPLSSVDSQRQNDRAEKRSNYFDFIVKILKISRSVDTKIIRVSFPSSDSENLAKHTLNVCPKQKLYGSFNLKKRTIILY